MFGTLQSISLAILVPSFSVKWMHTVTTACYALGNQGLRPFKEESLNYPLGQLLSLTEVLAKGERNPELVVRVGRMSFD